VALPRSLRWILIGLASVAGLIVLIRLESAISSAVHFDENRDGYLPLSKLDRVWVRTSPSDSPAPLVVDYGRVRMIEERCLDGFIDWHYAYRIECDSTVMDALVSTYQMAPRLDPELRSAFREVFPETVDCLMRSVAVSASPEFSHIGRGGPDGDHFAALYDEKTSRLYLWAHFNF